MNIKIYTYLILLLLISSPSVIAQKLSFQSVVHDSDNKILVSSPVGVRLKIIADSITGTVVYTETQTISTNDNGLITLVIGDGVSADNMEDIDWSTGRYYLLTEYDPTGSTNYTISMTTAILPVPVALYAKTAETLVNPPAETDPVFSSSVAAGITIADTTAWNNKSTFNGDFNNLSNKPASFDLDSTNEIQTLSVEANELTLSETNTISLPYIQLLTDTIPYITLASAGTSYIKIGDLLTFTKSEDSTFIEVTFSGNVKVENFTSSNGGRFQLRIDNTESNLNISVIPYFNGQKNKELFLQFQAIFPYLTSGNHTVSIWFVAANSGGIATNISVNPGNYPGGARYTVKEYY